MFRQLNRFQLEWTPSFLLYATPLDDDFSFLDFLSFTVCRPNSLKHVIQIILCAATVMRVFNHEGMINSDVCGRVTLEDVEVPFFARRISFRRGRVCMCFL